MMVRTLILWIILFCTSLTSSAQANLIYQLIFHPLYGNQQLIPGNKYQIQQNDSVEFSVLKFYVSGIELINEGTTVWSQKESFHLINAAKSNSLIVSLNLPQLNSFDEIKFNLGIDSITNVSGAMGGDLDPTKGMYWSWQSGYINFKLEGKSRLCKNIHQEFQFHLGGYQFPDNALQVVKIKTNNKTKCDIAVNIQPFLSGIDFTVRDKIMSPGKEAVEMSNNAVKIFSPLN
jgi:hypothetical protein